MKEKNNTGQALDFSVFTINTENGWHIINEQGIDSYVGKITNGKDTLSFDYGWYSSEIKGENANEHLYAQDTINGLLAIIEIPKVDGNGNISLSIPKVNNQNKFFLSGKNIKGTESILKIFKSIKFKNSDTSKNGTLAFSNFKEFSIGSNQTMYLNYCAACHHKFKDATGPALNKELLNSRDINWLTTFFYNRKNLKSDSLYVARKKIYEGVDCIILNKQLSKKDFESLISYLKTN